jgi:uncharacterized protein involved in type VI secretion and phage assembly
MSRVFGLVLGVVVDVDDPEGEGAVRVEYTAMEGHPISRWAPIVRPMAGKDRGVWLVPEVGDEAALAFHSGDPNRPYVLGFLYNGIDVAPSTAVRERLIRSVNGHTIRFIDSTPTPGGNKGALAIEDASGNTIVLANGKITIRSRGVLELDAPVIVLGGTTYKRVVTPNSNPI